MRFYTFYTDDLNPEIIEDHKKVCNKFGLEVIYFEYKSNNNYDSIYSAHGEYLTSILEEEDVACFLDIDCLPYNINYLRKAYNWAINNKSFVGNAQNISHTEIRNHIYAAASCLIITKYAWRTLGSPSLSWFIQNGIQIDTAQILTLRADQIGFSYQLMYPIGYDGPEEYKLSGFGNYGRGTLYPATYHWFRISDFNKSTPRIWSERVLNILNNEKITPKYRSNFYEL